jgi:hypothetical protein
MPASAVQVALAIAIEAVKQVAAKVNTMLLNIFFILIRILRSFVFLFVAGSSSGYFVTLYGV